MKANLAAFTLAAARRVLGLSISGYNDWLHRPPSARGRRNAKLKDRVMITWIDSVGVYGCPQVHTVLLWQTGSGSAGNEAGAW